MLLPGESQGLGSLVGCCLWDRRVGHDWSDLAAANVLHVLYAYIFIFWLPSIIWIYPSQLHKTLGISVRRTKLWSIPHENSLQDDTTLVTHILDCHPFLHLFLGFSFFCECVYLPIMVHVPCLFINEQVSGLMHTLGGAFSPVDLCVFVFSNFLDLKCGLLFFFYFILFLNFT